MLLVLLVAARRLRLRARSFRARTRRPLRLQRAPRRVDALQHVLHLVDSVRHRTDDRRGPPAVGLAVALSAALRAVPALLPRLRALLRANPQRPVVWRRRIRLSVPNRRLVLKMQRPARDRSRGPSRNST